MGQFHPAIPLCGHAQRWSDSVNIRHAASTVTLTYDAQGRKNRESLTFSGQTYQMSLNYDSGNRPQNITYPDGKWVNHQYNSRNLLATLKYPDSGAGSTIDTRTYDAGGRLTSETLGNGQVVTRSYLTGDNLPASIANTNVGNYGYGWEASPRRRPMREEKGEDAVVFERDKTSETITGAMSNYGFTVPTGGYDNQNRLTAWNRTDGARNQSWALSAVGDWNTFTDAGVAQTRTHGPAHEILTMAAATVTHDSRGNMTVDEQAKAFTWDTSNMLKQAVVPSGSSTGTAGTHLYKYDALGRRIAKTTDSTGTPFTTVYIHVGSQVYAEYQASQLYSNPLRKYTYGPYVDEPVLIVDRTAAGSVGDGTEERFYYHRNQQYSITALTDNAGAVVERYAYTAYGEPKILDGAGTTTRTASFIGNPYLYTAQEYDAETGLYYFNARMYEGSKGRFLSHDPILYPDGENTYAGWFACKGTDPSGLVGGIPNWPWPQPPHTGGIGLQFCYTPRQIKTPLECCASLRDQFISPADPSMRKYVTGGVACCDGRKVACYFFHREMFVPTTVLPEFPDVDHDAAIGYRDCVLNHETYHANQSRTCSRFRDHIDKYSKSQQSAEECEAYRISAECLYKKLLSCPTRACKFQLSHMLQAERKIGNAFCRDAGLPEVGRVY